ncbi:Hydroxylamine oxidoreductase (Fragment) [hydrothermal vent metagenome]|uniref:Hydroxylamine oxidoreductase n=1 Tax=hydrothermal vent metagenome TaxID=652676 RepID=A0A3B1CI03_9ZZZZ
MVARILLISVFVFIIAPSAWAGEATVEKLQGKCMTCHKRESPGLYNQWVNSKHAKRNVTCYACHQAKKGEPDAFTHEGLLIATLVTPKDCGKCHDKQQDEVAKSHHAKAGRILDSLDNYLADVMVGRPAVIAGCESCHGVKVEIDPESPNKLSKASWPNSGIGRINPDGSEGACNACHSRHTFSKEQARRPENCGKCHLGPDHPQKEIYEESKHGIAYRNAKEKMNLDKDKWVVGVDYYQAPTCATCHMSATQKQKVTHDVGARISWNLRSPVSKPKKDSKAKRGRMMDVCQACHGKRFAEGFYRQFDGVVNLYDEKFAKPAKTIISILKKNKSFKNKAKFSNEVEWIWWEIWHHEGRRARHGAAMMGPDYTWWHGLYEVGKHFYMKFIPAVGKLGDKEADAYIDRLFKTDWHRWYKASVSETKMKLKSGEMTKMYEGLYAPPWERK